MILFTFCFDCIMETAASQWTDNIICLGKTFCCSGLTVLGIAVVYEFYSILHCSRLCCIIEGNEGNMLDVCQCQTVILALACPETNNETVMCYRTDVCLIDSYTKKFNLQQIPT